jgi:hypothetical protein
MAGFFVLWVGARRSRGDSDRVAGAHLCPLGPLERPVELLKFGIRQPFAPPDGMRVDAEGEGGVLMPDLGGRVRGIVAGDATKRCESPTQAVRRHLPDRLDPELGEPLVRTLDRGEEESTADRRRRR